MRKAKDVLFTIILISGIVLLLYPSISNLWNRHTQTKAIANYDYVMKDMTKEEQAEMLKQAKAWNRNLRENASGVSALTESEREEYERTLDVTGTGIMGYIEVPEIGIRLPIYHGTSAGVLRVGAGHMEGTSLPVGGKGTHAVISGHTGLPSSQMFDQIVRLRTGDLFKIQVLDRTLWYKVDQIKKVAPGDTKDIRIVPGKDYVTMITCTPYGINDYRLLVRGERTSAPETEPEINNTDYITILMLVLAGILAIILGLLRRKIRKRNAENVRHFEGGKDHVYTL